MNPLRVLITNNTLDARAGTELYVYDLAVALLKRGHQPIAYSNRLGQVASELRNACVPVIDQLDSLSVAPDIIHGHHHLDAMTAMLHFPTTPGVLFCHSWRQWLEMPVQFPRIRRYLAMNQSTYNRLAYEHGVSEQQVVWMPNFVDLDRFQPRAQLPTRPTRALVFCNYATADGYLRTIRAACDRAELSLDVIGLGVGNPVSQPWQILGDYDVIFASGRCALESLAVGAAVIICNNFGLGPMITAEKLDDLRRRNFGPMTAASRPFDVDDVLNQLARYCADDATEVSRRIRDVAGLETTVDRLLDLYAEVITEHEQRPPCHADESRAAAAYLRKISDQVKSSGEVQHWLDVERAEHDALRHHHAVLQASLQTTDSELGAMRQTLTWRLHQRLTRVNFVMRLHRLLRRSRSR